MQTPMYEAKVKVLVGQDYNEPDARQHTAPLILQSLLPRQAFRVVEVPGSTLKLRTPRVL